MRHLKISVLFVAVVCVWAFNIPIGHCGRKTITEKRELSPFDQIVLNISADVTVKKGDEYTCSITADHDLTPLIVTECNNQILSLSLRSSFTFTGKITIEITSPLITRVKINGSGGVKLQDVTKDMIDLTIDGSGGITAIGKAVFLNAVINGSGNIDADALEVETAEVIINGSGDMNLNVTKQLSAEVRGSGDILYSGSPEIKSSVVKGSGHISAKSRR